MLGLGIESTAHTFSCNEKHASALFFFITDFVADKRPENDTSFPFTEYGNET